MQLLSGDHHPTFSDDNDADNSTEAQKTEACYEALAGLVPPELTLTKGNIQSTVSQLKMFRAKLTTEESGRNTNTQQ